jgi:hypothetical protein
LFHTKDSRRRWQTRLLLQTALHIDTQFGFFQVPELEDQGILLYRELIIPSWRIIYRISEMKVCVLSVLDARQNVEDILLKKLIYPK